VVREGLGMKKIIVGGAGAVAIAVAIVAADNASVNVSLYWTTPAVSDYG
jgi:hypothetical protein